MEIPISESGTNRGHLPTATRIEPVKYDLMPVMMIRNRVVVANQQPSPGHQDWFGTTCANSTIFGEISCPRFVSLSSSESMETSVMIALTCRLCRSQRYPRLNDRSRKTAVHTSFCAIEAGRPQHCLAACQIKKEERAAVRQ